MQIMNSNSSIWKYKFYTKLVEQILHKFVIQILEFDRELINM